MKNLNPDPYGMNSLNTTGDRATAFEQAEDTFQQISKLRARIDEVVNRLCGTEPREAGSAGGPAPANGLFEDLSRAAIEARIDIDRAHDALSRLERSI